MIDEYADIRNISLKMALKNNKKLSIVPSVLLGQALDDISKAEKSKRITIDMDTWAEGNGNNKCSVCFAGSVMINRVDPIVKRKYLGKINFSDTEDSLNAYAYDALDRIRPYDIQVFLSRFRFHISGIKSINRYYRKIDNMCRSLGIDTEQSRIEKRADIEQYIINNVLDEYMPSYEDDKKQWKLNMRKIQRFLRKYKL